MKTVFGEGFLVGRGGGDGIGERMPGVLRRDSAMQYWGELSVAAEMRGGCFHRSHGSCNSEWFLLPSSCSCSHLCQQCLLSHSSYSVKALHTSTVDSSQLS